MATPAVRPTGGRINFCGRAIDAFWSAVSARSGLPPDHILFVSDGMRPHLYNASTIQFTTGSYADQMRRYFMDHAGQNGFDVMNLHPRFSEHFATNRRNFELQTGNHWNTLGHELCQEAISQSALYKRFSTLTLPQ